MEQPTAVVQVAGNVIEAIRPFQPDDGHKGTFLVLRIAGLERSSALKLVKRGLRCWKAWRDLDPDFNRIEEQLPVLCEKFGGEARVLRTAMLDISIIETGNSIFQRVFSGQVVNDSMWAYVTKLAGIRLPMIAVASESGNTWEKLANSIKRTLGTDRDLSAKQRQLTVSEMTPDGTERTVTAKETVIIRPEHRNIMDSVIDQVMNSNGVES